MNDVCYMIFCLFDLHPGQWGVPTFSLSAILGVFAANIATTIESVGDYHACARLIDEPSPPPHVINRGETVIQYNL